MKLLQTTIRHLWPFRRYLHTKVSQNLATLSCGFAVKFISLPHLGYLGKGTMIEVIAKLMTGPVYLGGESIECHVTFYNHLVPQHKTSQSSSDGLETLAWASAQINCQCSTNGKVILGKKIAVSFDSSQPANSANLPILNTSFAPCRGERGHVVYSTKPKILFCDLSLAPGESKTYVYREVLSSEAPPTYRGSAVMYSYKITIGMQRISSPIKQLQVPFKVLVVNGFPDLSICGDSEDLAPSNPFLENEEKESPLDLALQSLQNITARRTPNFYNITNARGKVVRFCLFKNSYKLGEDIVGTFDFSESTVPCFQFSVTLQSEEEIPADNRTSGKQSCAISPYSKHHEVCLSLKFSQLILPIPLHVTPAFSTSLVKLRWRLHFKFVTAVNPIDLQGKSADTDDMWQGPSSFDIETMVWNHYVNIYPTAPSQVAQGLQAQTKFSLTV